MSQDLKEELIRLGALRPDLRPDLRPILASLNSVTATQGIEYIVPSLQKLARDLHSTAFLTPEGDYGNVVLTLLRREAVVSYNMRWVGKKGVLDLGQLGFGPGRWSAVLSKAEVGQLTAQSQQDLVQLLKGHKVKAY